MLEYYQTVHINVVDKVLWKVQISVFNIESFKENAIIVYNVGIVILISVVAVFFLKIISRS